MSSLLGSLARSLSDRPRGNARMITVPSFNDFSLHTAQDAAYEERLALSMDERLGMSSPVALPSENDIRKMPAAPARVLQISTSELGVARKGWESAPSTPTPPLPIPAAGAHPRHHAYMPKRIHNLDLHEYVDLIRSL